MEESTNVLTDEIMAALALHGIEPSQSQVERFAALLQERQMYALSDRSSLQIRDGVDILRFIKEAKNAGDADEAFWRAFLVAYFGRPSAHPNHSGEVESAGRFLCAFGDKPTWTWAHVSTQDDAFRDQLSERQADLDALHFGNHRKRRATHKPEKVAKVIKSFVQWIGRHGGSPSAAFTPQQGSTPKRGFGELYDRFVEVDDFNRTGCFDLLCLLRKMELLEIEPDSCHLVGSTGPLRGAAKLCGKDADKLTKREKQELNTFMDDLADHQGISYAVMEDSLCHWQKEQMASMLTIQHATSDCSNKIGSAVCP